MSYVYLYSLAHISVHNGRTVIKILCLRFDFLLLFFFFKLESRLILIYMSEPSISFLWEFISIVLSLLFNNESIVGVSFSYSHCNSLVLMVDSIMSSAIFPYTHCKCFVVVRDNHYSRHNFVSL